MKKAILSLLFVAACMQYSSAQIPVIASWIVNTNGDTGYTGISSNCQTVQFDSTDVYVSCTCIPGYNIGPWPGDPNVATNQNFTYKITRNPAKNTGTPVTMPLGHVGIWTNGVSVFNSEDANSYNNKNIWHQNAEVVEGSSFDKCLGHPDQTGEYHHHVNPVCLYNYKDNLHHSPIIGYAFDGYPIYGAYGYANPNGTGGIKRMRSSYQLRTKMVNRDTLPDGTVLSPANYGPPVSASYPLGMYIEDYAYDSGSGDLDSHNGRYCVTPEYPGGTYAYFVTIDSNLNPVYPYTLGLTYYGVVQPGNTGPGSGNNVPPAGTKVYTPPAGISEVSQQKITYTLSPNPVEDYTHIYFGANSSNNITATLYNAQGQALKTYQNWHTSISYTIDMSSYPAGLYFLHLQTANSQVVQKIIKIK